MKAAPDRAAASGPIELLLGCPKCGAPFTADDTVVTTTCEHCGSLLLLAAPDREEIYVADGIVRGADDLLEVVLLYRVQAQRAEIVARNTDHEGNPPPEELILARLAAYERKLRQSARVLEAHRIHAPYGHVTGAIVQGILGRRRAGPKMVRLRSFAVEHTVPGYDGARFNLRDRGLRLARSSVRPLTCREAERLAPFLPRVPLEERTHREIERFRMMDLDRELDAVAKHGQFCPTRQLVVYRPYWLVRAETDEPPRWMLVDGSFGTIAGYPPEEEVGDLLRHGTGDPLRSGEESFRRVAIIASRCPDCGAEQSLDPRAHVQVCTNCHLPLAPATDGVRIQPCEHAAPGHAGEADYLPFWRFQLAASVAGSPAATTFEDYARALFPQAAPPGFRPRGSSLWIPAFRLLGTEQGDEAFRSLAESLHAAPPEVRRGKVPLSAPATFRAVTVSEREARMLAPFALLGVHGKTSAARLNTHLLRRAVGDSQTAPEAPGLVLVPFRSVGTALEGAGTQIPRLLLQGGPALEAQRATVHDRRRA